MSLRTQTYDCTVVNRMLQGKKVIVHGDGSSLWTLTHHVDFAKGFVGLLGNARTVGDAAHDSRWGVGLMGDKAHSLIFDNSKIKRLVPDFAATILYARGAQEVMAWYNADPARRKIKADFDQLCDRLIASYESIWPTT